MLTEKNHFVETLKSLQQGLEIKERIIEAFVPPLHQQKVIRHCGHFEKLLKGIKECQMGQRKRDMDSGPELCRGKWSVHAFCRLLERV